MDSGTHADADDQVFDIIGCGFGPSNLAVAAALTDRWSGTQNASRLQRVAFIERNSSVVWHPGMLLPGTRMQISYLKDLVTLRQPTSPLSFLSYLHAHDRLVSFINCGHTTPTRREYADYLAWCAEKVVQEGVRVMFSEEVVNVSSTHHGLNGQSQGCIIVTSRQLLDGKLLTRQTKNLILAFGGSPRIPRTLSKICDSTAPDDMICLHTSAYKHCIDPVLARLSRSQRNLRIAVIGGGQSAAEVTLDLVDRLSSIPAKDEGRHTIDMIIKKGCLKPSDDSPFVNEIFNPAATDAMYNLPSYDAGRRVLSEYENANYGVVNPRTLQSLYEVIYDQKIDEGIAKRLPGFKPSRPLLVIRNYQKIISSAVSSFTNCRGEVERQARISLEHLCSEDLQTVDYDAVICGTGYERLAWLNLLRSSGLGAYFGLDHDDMLVPANSKVSTTTPSECLQHKLPNHQNGFHAEIPAAESLDLDSSSCPSTGPETVPSSPASSETYPHHHLNLMNVKISRNYQLLPSSRAAQGFEARIYLQGCTEATHGLSDTLLSVVSVRAGEIVDDILANRANELSS